MRLWLQPGGPDTAHPLEPAGSALHYELPEFGVRLAFRPTDFTQVNHAINRLLVARALELPDPRPGERIADLFCGLGIFSLPFARCGAGTETLFATLRSGFGGRTSKWRARSFDEWTTD